MRFLADESCDFRVVRGLRAAGHDVMAVVEFARGAEDDATLELAAREGRIFVTEDRDFGQLVYAAARPAPGVILLRFPANARAAYQQPWWRWWRGTARNSPADLWWCSLGGYVLAS